MMSRFTEGSCQSQGGERRAQCESSDVTGDRETGPSVCLGLRSPLPCLPSVTLSCCELMSGSRYLHHVTDLFWTIFLTKKPPPPMQEDKSVCYMESAGCSRIPLGLKRCSPSA